MDDLELHAYLEERRVLAESMRAGYIKQIQDGLLFYDGLLPEPFTKGGSSYVDRTVYDQVKGVTSQLNDTFMSADSVVKFKTKQPQMEVMAKVATHHINQVVLKQNNGYNMLRSAIHASLKEKACYLMPYWVKSCEWVEEEVTELSEEAIGVLSMNPDVEFDILKDENGIYSGTVSVKMDTSTLQVDQVPFEQVAIDHNARIYEEANYICRRINKIRGIFLEEGVKVHKNATFVDDHLSLKVYRDPDGATSYLSISNDDKESALRDYVTVYEHYIKMKLKGKFSWWKVLTDSIHVISKEEVDGHGIVRLEPLPAPFSIYGDSIPDITKDIQTAMTLLIRGMFDNIQYTNHPQVLALEGQFDKRDLLNKQPNGVIQIKTPQAIQYVAPQQITPSVQLLYSMVSSARDTRTGLSNAAQGLDDTIFKNDNAYATVQAVQTQALQRTKDIALNLAHGGFTELFKQCYKEVRENDTNLYNTVIDGRPVTYSPSQFPELIDVCVDTTVSPSDKAAKVQAMNSLVAMINQLPVTQQMQLFGPEEQYNFIHSYSKALNFDNIGSFLKPVEMGQPTQPSPMEMAQAKLAESEVALKQAQAMKEQSIAQKNGMDVQLDTQKLMLEQQFKTTEAQLKDKRLSFEQDRAAVQDSLEKEKLNVEKIKAGAEIQIESHQKRAALIGKD